jgi:geranylgeranyl reductase family protein
MAGLKTYDVVIVGAGPAGTILAYLLAKEGVEVLIIEKQPLPRYKPCAGGLTRRAVAALPFEVKEVVEDEAYTIRTFLRNEPLFVETEQKPIVSMVMRDRFDQWLVKKALDEGARIEEGVGFKSLFGSPGHLTVTTSRGDFGCRLVVGADGVNSRVARALGLEVRRKTMVAVQGEVYSSDPCRIDGFRNSAHFDFGVIPKGYAWVFPKKDHLSIGVLTTSRKVKHLRGHFYSYLKLKELNDCAIIRSLRLHLIPFHPDRRNRLSTERGLVVGDATGFADPITGEGIFHAIKESRMASEVLLKALRSGYHQLPEYSRLLKEEMMEDLQYAQRFAGVLYRISSLSTKIIKSHGSTLGRYHTEVISGTKTYRELYRKTFKLWKLIPALMSSKQ